MRKEFNYKYILKKLLNSNETAFIVGGAVRDELLGLPIKDTDITTSASLEKIKSIFSSLPILSYGEKHNTVGVRYKGETFEITSYKGKTLEDDLAARDFSINSIAKSLGGKYFYAKNSKKDLENKILRMNSRSSIKDDPIRILRALRISSTKNLKIEKNTLKTLICSTNLLIDTARERITTEVSLLITSKGFLSSLFMYKSFYEALFKMCKLTNLENYDLLLKKLALVKDDFLVLNTLLIIVYLGTDTQQFTSNIKGSNFERKLKSIINQFYIGKDNKKDILSLATLLYEKDFSLSKTRLLTGYYGILNMKRLLIILSILQEDNALIDTLNNNLKLIEQKHLPTKVSDLEITGYDFISLGIKGKKIKIVKNILFNKVINCELSNNKGELIDFIKDYCI